jgi:hypothetical protein
MTEPHTPTPAEWAAHWKRVSPMLEARRREELRNLTDEEAGERLESLFPLALATMPPRRTSGLIEVRRRLDQWYRKTQAEGEP